MIYRFRVILDVDTDVFRDIEVESQINLEDVHKIQKEKEKIK